MVPSICQEVAKCALPGVNMVESEIPLGMSACLQDGKTDYKKLQISWL